MKCEKCHRKSRFNVGVWVNNEHLMVHYFCWLHYVEHKTIKHLSVMTWKK